MLQTFLQRTDSGTYRETWLKLQIQTTYKLPTLSTTEWSANFSASAKPTNRYPALTVTHTVPWTEQFMSLLYLENANLLSLHPDLIKIVVMDSMLLKSLFGNWNSSSAHRSVYSILALLGFIIYGKVCFFLN